MKKSLFVIIPVWVLLVGTSLIWNLEHFKKDHEEIALQAARSFFRQIVLTQSWNASHTGIYAPTTEKLQPNPHLTTPLRDVVTTDGQHLTMVNSAYMTRQIAEIAAQEEGVRIHITSLKPVRPENKPTEWEAEWLKSFELGEAERYEIVHQDSDRKFQYMMPLVVEKECLQCHSGQGYKEGDLRGGISITLPFIFQKTTFPLWVGHGVTVLIGLVGIFLAGGLLRHSRQKLVNSNEQLEKEISERIQTEEVLRQAEREWDHTFNSMTDFVSVHDKNHRFIKVNKALADFLGQKAEELIGKRCYEIVHGMDEPWSSCPHSKALEQKKPFTSEVYDPHVGCPLLVTASPIYEENGDLRGTVHIARNITEIKEAEKEQQNLLKQLQQAQKLEAIGTMAGGIAHDFNNILTAIFGYTNLLALKLPKTNSSQSYLGEIIKAGHRAKDLVNQILTFSRQADYEHQPLEIQHIIEEVFKLLRASIPCSIEIRQYIDQNCQPVLADPTQVHQVLINLCTNAAHAMKEKGGVLEIRLENTELNSKDLSSKPDLTPGKYAKLTVSDTGQGMSKEIIERIFEPFYTTKEMGEGTGLGLSVVHGIIKSHDAIITVDSQPGKGSTFNVFFPEIELKTTQKTKTDASLPVGNNEQILLVENEEVIARMTQSILIELGYDVTVRTSSVEAFNCFKAQSEKFELVITESTMPNMTGLELTKELLKIRPKLPVILCTGYSEVGSMEKAKAIGIREYLMKPIDMAALAQAVRKVLDENKA